MKAWGEALVFTCGLALVIAGGFMVFDLLRMLVGTNGALAIMFAFFACVAVVRGVMRLVEEVKR